MLPHLLMRYRINGMLVVKDEDPIILSVFFTTTDCYVWSTKLYEQKQKIDALEEVSDRPVGQEATRDIISFQKDTKITKVIAIMHKGISIRSLF